MVAKMRTKKVQTKKNVLKNVLECKEMRKIIEKSSKDMICKNDDIVPQFFIIDREGKLTLIAMPLPDVEEDVKEKSVEALKILVEKLGSERFYAAMTGWGINQEKIKQIQEQKMKEYNEGKITVQDLMDYSRLLRNNPTNNPAREEFLILNECSKNGTSMSKLISIERDKDDKNPVFKDVDEKGKWSKMPEGSFRWNIWARGQFDETR